MSLVKGSMPVNKTIGYKSELALCITLALMIFAGLQISLAMYAAIVIGSIVIIFSTNNSYILYLFFLLPFSGIFKTNLTGSISGINVLIIIVTVKQLVYVSRKRISFKPTQLLLFFSLFTYCIVTSMGVFIDLLQIILCFLFVILYLRIAKEGEGSVEFKDIVIFYAMGLILASSLALLTDYYPALSSVLQYASSKFVNGTRATRYSGLIGSPNYYSVDLTIAMSGLFVLYARKEIRKLFFIMSALLMIYGLMTLSKSFLVSILFLFVYIIILSFNNSYADGLKLLVSIALLCLLTYVVIDKDVLANFIMRVQNDFSDPSDLASITTSRTVIFSSYWTYITENLNVMFFGEGMNADLLWGFGTHNAYLEIWYYLGLLGSMIYITLISSIIRPPRNLSQVSFVSLLPLFMFLLRACAINLMFRDNIYFYMILIASALSSKSVLRTKTAQDYMKLPIKEERHAQLDI